MNWPVGKLQAFLPLTLVLAMNVVVWGALLRSTVHVMARCYYVAQSIYN